MYMYVYVKKILVVGYKPYLVEIKHLLKGLLY